MIIQAMAEVGGILFVEGAHWLLTKASYRLCKRVAIKINKVVSLDGQLLSSTTLHHGIKPDSLDTLNLRYL